MPYKIDLNGESLKFEWDNQNPCYFFTKENDMNSISRTDWSRVDALTDEDIDTSDIPPLTEEFFAKARWRIPVTQMTVIIRIDPETFEWFRSQGENSEQQMAAALRIYAESNKLYSGKTA